MCPGVEVCLCVCVFVSSVEGMCVSSVKVCVSSVEVCVYSV